MGGVSGKVMVAAIIESNSKAWARVEEADLLLSRALEQLDKVDHDFACPRNRDDFDCTCGLSEVRYDIEEWFNKWKP